MRKVLFVINSLTGGGAERIMARLLSNSGSVPDTELHLALLDDEVSAYTLPDWVTIHRLDTGGSLIGGFVPLFQLIKTLKPAICVSFLSRSNFLAIVACKLLSVRSVISERVNTSSHHPAGVRGLLPKLLTRLLYPLADCTIAVSQGIGDDLSSNYGVPTRRIAVIPNPIDADFVLAQGKATSTEIYTSPLVVGVGRLVPNKNFEMLIDAFHALGGSGTLVILGEGPLRQQLEARAAAHGIKERVVFPGFQNNPFKTIGAADCFVCPSNTEGFPNSLVEAMILGRPVVSTNCHSGPAEILDDRPYFEVSGVTVCKYGVLVPTGDTKSFAAGLALALDPDNNTELANAARQGAARYRLAETIARYWQAIDGISTTSAAT